MALFTKATFQTAGLCLILSSTPLLSGCETLDFLQQPTDTKTLIEQAMSRAIKDEAQSASSVKEQVAYYKKLHSLNPGNIDNAMHYATALRKAGRAQEALYILLPFKETGKTLPNTYLTELAATRLSLGNIEKANTLLESVLNKDSSNPRANHLMGIVQDSYGQHDKAEEHYKIALKKWDSDPTALLNNIALNQAHRGQIEQAVATLYQAATISPNRVEIRENLAILQSLNTQNLKEDSLITSSPLPAQRPQLLLPDGSSVTIPLPPRKPEIY